MICEIKVHALLRIQLQIDSLAIEINNERFGSYLASGSSRILIWNVFWRWELCDWHNWHFARMWLKWHVDILVACCIPCMTSKTETELRNIYIAYRLVVEWVDVGPVWEVGGCGGSGCEPEADKVSGKYIDSTNYFIEMRTVIGAGCAHAHKDNPISWLGRTAETVANATSLHSLMRIIFSC